MYHYKESGLSNVHLDNGYSLEQIDGETFLSIEDVDGLHQQLAMDIVQLKTALNPQQFRFLRIELDLSQKKLADLLGVDVQSVARWEKGQTALPRSSDMLLRLLYLEQQQQAIGVKALLQSITDGPLDIEVRKNLKFDRERKLWLG